MLVDIFLRTDVINEELKIQFGVFLKGWFKRVL